MYRYSISVLNPNDILNINRITKQSLKLTNDSACRFSLQWSKHTSHMGHMVRHHLVRHHLVLVKLLLAPRTGIRLR